jgi:RNA polymerase primary sigma factor
VEELADATGYGFQQLDSLRRIADLPLSLNRSSSGLDERLVDFRDRSPGVSQETREALRKVLAKLNDREQQVISWRFGLGTAPRTLAEIGAVLSVTKERVRQIEQDALRKLRELPRPYAVMEP